MTEPTEAPEVAEPSHDDAADRRRRRRAIGIAASTALFCAWALPTILLRLENAWSEFAADGDQPQAIFYYWNYHLDGVFPDGNPLTEFASVMHTPPVWWLLMATLSVVIEPLFAAKLLNLVALVLTPLMAYAAVRQRSNHFIALAAAALLLRSTDFAAIIAGGYARSFGPFLVYLFLWAFIGLRHRACLGILVFQAAFYPSVVIPCGLVYGAYVVLAGPTMKQRLRRCAGMFVAGILIIGFGKYQDLKRPEWWGPLVWKSEAEKEPAWFRPDGRFHDLPLRPLSEDIRRQSLRAFRADGNVLFNEAIVRFDREHKHLLILAPPVLCVLVLVALWLRRRRRGLAPPDEPERFPWQITALAGAAFFSLLLTRGFAFKLYVPIRVTAHVWPYLIYAAVPLVTWHVLRRLWPNAPMKAIAWSVVLALLPSFGISGDGTGNRPRTYVDYGSDAAVWRAIRELPKDALIAGSNYHTDRIPLFSVRQVYANKTLSQPWRMAYYDECERRMLETYRALYATDLHEVVRFAEQEDVDYLVYSPKRLRKLDGRLFEPVRSKLAGVHAHAKRRGFVLEEPPKDAVVFQGRGTVVLDMERLRKLLPPDRDRPGRATVPKQPSSAAPTAPSPVE